MPIWNEKVEEVWATANTSKAVTFAVAPASNELVVIILQLAQTGGPTSVSGATLRDSYQNGSNWQGIYTASGNGARTSFSFTTASVVGSAVGMVLPGYTTTALERTGVKKSFSNSSTKNIDDLVGGTAGANTVVIASASLTSAPSSWGTWNNGYEMATTSATSRLSVGVKAFAAAGVTDVDTTIANSPNRAGNTVAWVVYSTPVSETNEPPTVTITPAVIHAFEDTVVSIHAEASDPEAQTLVYSWSTIDCDITNPTISGNGTADITITPSKALTAKIRCTVTDSGGLTDFADVQLIVHPDRQLSTHYRGVKRPRVKNRGVTSLGNRYRGKALSKDLGLISEWHFTESNAPFYNTDGALPLRGGDLAIVLSTTSPWGQGVSLDGTNFLEILTEHQGALNLGATTSQVTVAAWVQRTDDLQMSFVAGSWPEGTSAESYGLVIDVPSGGEDKSAFMVSDGTFNSDNFSAHPGTINTLWQFHAATFDGNEIRSYLNGNFTGATGRNPYAKSSLLNDLPAMFSVGGTYVMGLGYTHYLAGTIARLRVWDRALSAGEIAYLYEKDSEEAGAS